MYQIPKLELINIIVEESSNQEIKEYFKIGEGTNIKERLLSFTKSELSSYISNKPSLRNKILILVNQYPLKKAPTLYVVIVSNKESDLLDNLVNTSKELEDKLNKEAVVFKDDKSIRAVYTKNYFQEIYQRPSVYELMLSYEKKIDYNESDPNNPKYGELITVYSLESALFWLPKTNYKFGIIASCDFASVKPILKYLNQKYQLNVSLPDLSQEMLTKISEGSKIRNATFSLIDKSSTDEYDADSITVFDDFLSDRKIFKNISKNSYREQKSGFYLDHPDILRAGLGITRRYGRVWTPAHLNKDELVRLSLGITKKLSDELNKLVDDDDFETFTGFYANVKVKVENRELKGDQRMLFDKLIQKIITADRNKNKNKIKLDNDLIIQIVKNKKVLGLNVNTNYDCPNCGKQMAKCQNCGNALDVKYETNSFHNICSSCKKDYSDDDIICQCGETISIVDFISHLFIHPSNYILDTVRKYCDQLHPSIKNPNPFIIIGNILYILKPKVGQKYKRYSLSDLNLWKRTANIQMQELLSEAHYKKILYKMREKCSINNYHPHKTDCQKCLNKNITSKEIKSAQICLLRLFGLPIGVKLDGIHHGYEGADIDYIDHIGNNRVRLGIHVKSKSKERRMNGLGRGVIKIKELYAQLYYTIYKELQKQQYDILGIGIPDKISTDVISSMEELLMRFRIPFIIIDKEDWSKVTSAAIEQADNS
jgi:predicted RNA-binding Zn-ribbon protein involved in translation (DUF1610 family)